MVTRVALRRAAILFLAGLLSAKATEVHAAGEMWTARGLITRIEAGWREETLSVEHTAPIVNPGNCPETRFGYATDPADPGRSLFHTVAEKAFENKLFSSIQAARSGCLCS